MFDKFKTVHQKIVDDLYNKIHDNNRRIFIFQQEIKALKGEK